MTLPAVRWQPSPNHGPRQQPIRFIILHGTWMADDAATLARLCDPAAEVSCHYFIDRAAQLYQLVNEADVAWHAGQSAWGDVQGLNQHSIGIEVANLGEGAGEPYSEAQYHTLEALLTHLLLHHQLTPEAVLGHSDIAPSRKDDPGRHFDWARLEAKGLAAPWQPTAGISDPLAALRQHGYVGADADILAAFQRRYFPAAVSGMLCPATRRLILGR